MNITDVHNSVKAHKRRKRRGRGAAAGSGKTCGRGQNGLGSRTGGGTPMGFTGGQTPIRDRMPKRGFNNARFRTAYQGVNLFFLENAFEAGEEVSAATLGTKGVKIARGEKVKVLGTGELTKALTLKVHAISKSAREKVEKAGGTIELVGPKAKAGAAEADTEAEKK